MHGIRIKCSNKHLKAKKDDVDLFQLPEEFTLKQIDVKKLVRLQKRIKNKHEKLMVDINRIGESLTKITAVINEKKL